MQCNCRRYWKQPMQTEIRPFYCLGLYGTAQSRPEGPKSRSITWSTSVCNSQRLLDVKTYTFGCDFQPPKLHTKFVARKNTAFSDQKHGSFCCRSMHTTHTSQCKRNRLACSFFYSVLTSYALINMQRLITKMPPTQKKQHIRKTI